jgi:hypothetical protein
VLLCSKAFAYCTPSSYFNALLFVAIPDLLDIFISFTRNKPGKRNLSTHQAGDLPGDFNIEGPNVQTCIISLFSLLSQDSVMACKADYHRNTTCLLSRNIPREILAPMLMWHNCPAQIRPIITGQE